MGFAATNPKFRDRQSESLPPIPQFRLWDWWQRRLVALARRSVPVSRNLTGWLVPVSRVFFQATTRFFVCFYSKLTISNIQVRAERLRHPASKALLPSSLFCPGILLFNSITYYGIQICLVSLKTDTVCQTVSVLSLRSLLQVRFGTICDGSEDSPGSGEFPGRC